MQFAIEAIQDNLEPYKMIWSHTGLYGAIQNYIESYRMIYGHIRLYGAIHEGI